MTNELVEQMFLPDGGPYSLGMSIAATSGSGKTTLLSHLIRSATKMASFKETRFVYVSVKGEHLFGESVKPTSNLDDAIKHMSKNQLTVFYPANPEQYEEDVDALIESVFAMAEGNENASFVVVVDDANILTGFESVNARPSPMLKKAAIAGRSMRIKLVTITHRLGNMPRLFNGNISGMILMNISKMDLDYAKRVFGLDPSTMEDLIDDLGGYKWAYIDLLNGDIQRFNPVPHQS